MSEVRRYRKFRQREPLRIPQNWKHEDRAFAIQLNGQLDDTYNKLGQLENRVNALYADAVVLEKDVGYSYTTNSHVTVTNESVYKLSCGLYFCAFVVKADEDLITSHGYNDALTLSVPGATMYWGVFMASGNAYIASARLRSDGKLTVWNPAPTTIPATTGIFLYGLFFATAE